MIGFIGKGENKERRTRDELDYGGYWMLVTFPTLQEIFALTGLFVAVSFRVKFQATEAGINEPASEHKSSIPRLPCN